MNKNRRVALKNDAVTLRRVISSLEQIRDEEEDSISNVPENLSFSEKYNEMTDAIDSIESAIDNINEAISDIEQITH